MTEPTPTTWIDLDKVVLPAGARSHDPAKLETLARDMEGEGQLQEIVVTTGTRDLGPGFEVVAGVGRVLAARKLRWKQIRASVRPGLSEFEKARITFAENEDREDVDAFYQAAQLARMLKAKNLTQQALGDELGISKALVSTYQTIDRFPAEFKAMFRRLNVGHLTQLARLDDRDKRVDLAKRTEQSDLSVRQLKSLVDKLLAPASRAAKPRKQPADPLAELWASMIENPAVPKAGWRVDYHKPDTWSFSVELPGLDRPADLAAWLEGMLAGVRGARGEAAKREKVVKDVLTEIGSRAKQARRARRSQPQSGAPGGDGDNAEIPLTQKRLPANAAEQAELEALAAKGPEAVYAWLFGAGDPNTAMVRGKTWQDIGCPDGLAATRQLIENLKPVKAGKIPGLRV